MTTFSRRVTLTALSAAMVFTASCGGGGSDDEGTPPAAPQVGGSAVKGVTRQADVILYEIDGTDITKVREVARTRTLSDGSYKLPAVADYAGGPVLIQIKPASDGATRVICDLRRPADPANACGKGVEFGDPVPVVKDTVLMESVLPRLDRARSNALNSTALTKVIAARAREIQKNGGTGKSSPAKAVISTEDAIELATSEVNQLAGGIDVVGTTPIDITKPVSSTATAEEIAYAALNAAVLSLGDDASTASGEDFLNDAVGDLAQEFKDGAIPKSDLRDLVEVASNQLADAGQTDTAGILATLAELAVGDGVFAPVPTVVADAGALDKAKGFVGTVCTIANQYADFEPDSNPFVQQIDQVGEISDAAASELFASVGYALDEAGFAFDTGQSPYTIESSNSSGVAKTATVTLSNASGSTTATIQGEVGDATLDLSAVFPTSGGESTGQSSYTATVSGIAQTTADTGVKLEISAGSAVVAVRDANAPIEDGTGGGQNVDRVDLDLDVVLSQKGATDNLAFEGIVGFTGLQCSGTTCATPSGEPIGTPTRFLLQGELRNSSGSLINGRINVAIPDATARRFNAELPYSSSNFIDGTVTVSARGKVPTLPDTVLTLALESKGAVDPAPGDSNGMPFGKFTVTLARDGGVALTISTETTASQLKPTSILLKNAEGVTLTLNNIAPNPASDLELAGDLLVSGVHVGQIQQGSSGAVRIVYDSGEFESFCF